MFSPVDKIFGPGGILSELLDSYETRPQQLEMAHRAYQAFKSRVPLIIEAPTGTGKTHAYLIPALLSGEQVVISTATKNLQDQIFQQDIPKLQKVWPTHFKAVLVKGRSNYLCLHKFFNIGQDSPLYSNPSARDLRLLEHIIDWANTTETGDRAEITGLPTYSPLWEHFSTTSVSCIGPLCAHYSDCYVTRARGNAIDADIIIANHHLVAFDLIQKEGEHSNLLPDYQGIVFDEAHRLESVLASAFSTEFGAYHVHAFLLDLQTHLKEANVNSSSVKTCVDNLAAQVDIYFNALRDVNTSHTTLDFTRWFDSLEPALQKVFNDTRVDVEKALVDLETAIARCSELGEYQTFILPRISSLIDDFKAVHPPTAPNTVQLIDQRSNGIVFLRSTPFDVSDQLSRTLLGKSKAVIFTSATIAADSGFDYFKRRLGIDNTQLVDEHILPEVFDYQRQCRLYIPSRLTPPEHAKRPKYLTQATTIIRKLIKLFNGRALLLFTSYATLNAIYNSLFNELSARFTILKQNDAAPDQLLTTFRNDVHSILFGTYSFWEGVDVKGEALSIVIIDKVPFGNINDPLNKARGNAIRQNGGDPFDDFSIPEAIITLKQGFGRLIRSRSDVGAVVVLDPRLLTRDYGNKVLSALPSAPLVLNYHELRDWWLSLPSPS